MKQLPGDELDQDFKSFYKLPQVRRDDPVANEKVVTILKLDSYQGRSVINNWLEKLRKENAFENVQQALKFLFDEKVGKLVSQKQNDGHHQVEWDASEFSNGVYYYRIEPVNLWM